MVMTTEIRVRARVDMPWFEKSERALFGGPAEWRGGPGLRFVHPTSSPVGMVLDGRGVRHLAGPGFGARASCTAGTPIQKIHTKACAPATR